MKLIKKALLCTAYPSYALNVLQKIFKYSEPSNNEIILYAFIHLRLFKVLHQKLNFCSTTDNSTSTFFNVSLSKGNQTTSKAPITSFHSEITR